MVSFWIYDITFLVLFSIWVVWFIRTRKKNLSKEGWIFMYRTQVGIRAINFVGDNFKKTLHFLKYIIVAVGFILMSGMLWMLYQTVWIYISRPEVTEVIKAPPIAPLIPYFPKLFGMESFFPPFYFTYFIVALAVVAIVHEFSHGIFMRLFKIKIKSTGIVFLGPILGAFVEEEQKDLEKKKKFEQMSVLGAGVFANALFALIFYLLYVLFFFSSFAASGYAFNSYGVRTIPMSLIDDVGEDIGNRSVFLNGQFTNYNLTEISVGEKKFYIRTENRQLISEGINGIDLSNYSAFVLDDSPALKNNLVGAIIQANDVKIKGYDDFRKFMEDTEPGDEVKFITGSLEGEREYVIELAIHPNDEVDQGYLGVGHSNLSPRGVVQRFFIGFMAFKDSSTYYAPTWDGNFVYFVFNLLWWIMVINLLVALFNMLPLGILDGGRFFYLTILGITRSEKFSKWTFKFMTYLILFAFLLLMLIWLFRIV